MSNLKGPLLTIISAVLLTSWFVSAKYLMKFTNPETLNLLWVGTGLVLAIILATIKKLRWFRTIKKYWKFGILSGATMAVGSIMMFYAVDSIGPTLSSFLIRFVLVFAVILGIIFLKERLTFIEVIGMLIAVVGAFIISFSGAGGIVQLSSLLVMISSFLFAINSLLTKIYVKRIEPLELIIVKDVFAIFIIFLYSIFTSTLQPVSFKILGLTALASGITSIIGFLFFLRALQLMNLTKVMIIRSLDPFLVIVYSYIFFGWIIPTKVQVFGGLMIMLGVSVIVAKHHIKKTADTIKLYALKFIGE